MVCKGWQEPDPTEQWQPRQVRELLDQVHHIARDNLGTAQGDKKSIMIKKKVREREFQIGDRVLVMLTDNGNKFLSWWQGPFKVMRSTGPVNYKVEQSGHQNRLQVYHVNPLKR